MFSAVLANYCLQSSEHRFWTDFVICCSPDNQIPLLADSSLLTRYSQRDRDRQSMGLIATDFVKPATSPISRSRCSLAVSSSLAVLYVIFKAWVYNWYCQVRYQKSLPTPFFVKASTTDFVWSNLLFRNVDTESFWELELPNPYQPFLNSPYI